MNTELADLMDKFTLTEYGSTVKTDCQYEVLIHDVVGRPGFEATALFDRYPNYTDMLALFHKYDIPAKDFIDVNDCQKDKVVFGQAHRTYLCKGVPIAYFTTERIRGSATKPEELYR